MRWIFDYTKQLIYPVSNILFFGCFVLFSSGSLAQSSEWINFNQTYYKIPVAKTGIYRITYNDLQNAGFPLGTVDPRLIQLYHRGQEQAILFKHEQVPADSKFDAAEYFEFYGKQNDGTLDADLYKPASLQPHTFYNLYSDTSSYFLTWNSMPVQGKRIETFSENNVTNIPKEIFHQQERLLVLHDQYSAGYTFSDYTQNAAFDQGEGWTGIALQQGQSKEYVLDLITSGVISAGLPQLELLLVGRDRNAHGVEIFAGPSSGTLRSLGTQNFANFETIKFSASLNWSDVGADGKLFIKVTALAATSNRFQLSASYLRLTFPQNYDLANAAEQVLTLPANASDKSYIELENPASGLRLWDVTDVNNVRLIGAKPVNASLSAVVSETNSKRKLLVTNVALTAKVKKVSFSTINPSNYNYLIISHPALMKSGGGYTDPVKAYAEYRSSSEGGGYSTLVISMDQLYNQFNYGETSPRAIYQFLKFMAANGDPKYLFLIGKGRDISSYQPYYRNPLPAGEMQDLVPSAGYPASDMLFSVGLKGTVYEPAIPTGRITATSPEQVAAYLNKIKEHELVPLSSDWKKEGLHLSGGILPSELPVFKSYVDGFKTIAEGEFWGGHVTSVSKRDPGVDALINVSEQINRGTNLVTLFGHSSPGALDFDIGFASDPVMGYANKGKYPAILINGCFAGAFFLNAKIFGEDWIFATEKGARNYIAHSSFGYANYLQGYTNTFYRVGFADTTYIKLGIGDVQKETARKYLATFMPNPNPISIAQSQQMILLGDPAVKLFGTANPDYSTSNESILVKSLDGKPVTAQSSAFALQIITKNHGAYKNKPMRVRVKRTLNDNSNKIYDSLFSPVLFSDTLLFKLKREETGSGTNRFDISIDPDNNIVELSETNNTASLTTVIPANSTRNLYPLPYSLVGSSKVDFKFQDTNLLADQRSFQLEIDTLPNFASSYLKKLTVSGKVLAKVSVQLPEKDSVVYYWRSRFAEPKADESKEWTASSFTIVRNGAEGWGQLRYGQLKDNEVREIVLNDQTEKIDYLETTATMIVKTFGSNNPALHTDVSVLINDAEYNLSVQGKACRDNTINLVAFNKTTLVPYAGVTFVDFLEQRLCGREPQIINSFRSNEIETGLNNDLAAYVNAIGVADSVFLFSIGDAGFASWPATAITKLGELGISATQITSLQPGEPVVIRGKKGAAPGTAKIFRTSATPVSEQELQVSLSITGSNTTGDMKSVLIGPSLLWSKLILQTADTNVNDQVTFSIYGLNQSGTESLLQSGIKANLNLSFVDAKTYPYMRVEMKLKDEIDLSAAQLKKWMVLYDPAPEGMLVFLGNRNQQLLQEGQSFQTQFGFVNISEEKFSEPLKVDYEVLSKSTSTLERKNIVINAPNPNDTTKFLIPVDTRSKAGLNDLAVNVNNGILPENFYENNQIRLADHLKISRDQIPPVLDVSVEGRYLLNGDYVSVNPVVQLKLFDENKFLIKVDTVGIRMFLKYPKTTIAKPIYFKSPNATWAPATLTSPFMATARLKDLQDGEYELSIDAADVSGNRSGADFYRVSFNVLNESTFQFRSAYPNPSEGNFNFNFLLTGNSLPEEFELQIFSSQGGLVQKFTHDDVKNFVIGTNELTWNGKGPEGYALEEGIYFFRLRLLLKGKESAQQGKLMLLR